MTRAPALVRVIAVLASLSVVVGQAGSLSVARFSERCHQVADSRDRPAITDCCGPLIPPAVPATHPAAATLAAAASHLLAVPASGDEILPPEPGHALIRLPRVLPLPYDRPILFSALLL
jgi:hypothetical protein